MKTRLKEKRQDHDAAETLVVAPPPIHRGGSGRRRRSAGSRGTTPPRPGQQSLRGNVPAVRCASAGSTARPIALLGRAVTSARKPWGAEPDRSAKSVTACGAGVCPPQRLRQACAPPARRRAREPSKLADWLDRPLAQLLGVEQCPSTRIREAAQPEAPGTSRYLGPPPRGDAMSWPSLQRMASTDRASCVSAPAALCTSAEPRAQPGTVTAQTQTTLSMWGVDPGYRNLLLGDGDERGAGNMDGRCPQGEQDASCIRHRLREMLHRRMVWVPRTPENFAMLVRYARLRLEALDPDAREAAPWLAEEVERAWLDMAGELRLGRERSIALPAIQAAHAEMTLGGALPWWHPERWLPESWVDPARVGLTVAHSIGGFAASHATALGLVATTGVLCLTSQRWAAQIGRLSLMR